MDSKERTASKWGAGEIMMAWRKKRKDKPKWRVGEIMERSKNVRSWFNNKFDGMVYLYLGQSDLEGLLGKLDLNLRDCGLLIKGRCVGIWWL